MEDKDKEIKNNDTAEKSADNKTADSKPTGKPAGKPAGNKPTGSKPAGNKPSGNRPSASGNRKPSGATGRKPASGNRPQPEEAPKGNSKNIIIIVTCAILALILVCVLVVYLVIKSYVGKINQVDPTDWSINYTDPTPTTNSNGETEDQTPTETMPPEIDSQGADIFGDGEGMERDYVTNILLIGTDNRHFENLLYQPGNADTIILMSVNSKTKKIYLTSIMRDTAAYIKYTDEMKSKHNNWKDGYDKINLANARGGPEFLLDTVEGNFKVKLDDYVLVDFYSLIDIIDILGGIPMTLTDDEAKYANNYIRDMDFDRGIADWQTANVLSGGGNLILNGVQAVGYARERQSTGSDYTRTDRQRAVIEQIFIKAKSMNLSKINELANAILPKVFTNMSENKIMGMVADALTYLGYGIEQVRIPFDNLYTTPNGNLLPDYEATIKKLQDIIFATE